MTEESPRRRRQRLLSDAERTLWSEVTRGVARLRSTTLIERDAEPGAETPPQPAAERNKQRPVVLPPPQNREQNRPPPLAPLDRRMRQRIARGTHAIGGRLDLHGLTQREAHDTLFRFLRSAQQRDVTLVLVITGKGAPGVEAGHERGVLRRQVPHWLRLPAFRDLVVGFEPAHVTHGGEGALYVRVRKSRDAATPLRPR